MNQKGQSGSECGVSNGADQEGVFIGALLEASG